MKERLLERRSNLIEDLIKTDHTYRPPADYRPAKKHRKVRRLIVIVARARKLSVAQPLDPKILFKLMHLATSCTGTCPSNIFQLVLELSTVNAKVNMSPTSAHA